VRKALAILLACSIDNIFPPDFEVSGCPHYPTSVSQRGSRKKRRYFYHAILARAAGSTDLFLSYRDLKNNEIAIYDKALTASDAAHASSLYIWQAVGH